MKDIIKQLVDYKDDPKKVIDLGNQLFEESQNISALNILKQIQSLIELKEIDRIPVEVFTKIVSSYNDVIDRFGKQDFLPEYQNTLSRKL